MTGGDFSYRITISTGKTTSTVTVDFSYWIVDLAWSMCPQLVVRRENVMDKFKGALGFDDIDFESEAFSRAFLVKSKDKKFAYDLIDPRMMQFLTARLRFPLELGNGRLLVADGRSLWTRAGFSRQLAFATEFVQCWPDHLASRLDERHGARRA